MGDTIVLYGSGAKKATERKVIALNQGQDLFERVAVIEGYANESGHAV